MAAAISHSSCVSLRCNSRRSGIPSTPSMSQTLNSNVKAVVEHHSTRLAPSPHRFITISPSHFLDRIDAHALTRFAAGAVLQIELMGMQRTDDLSRRRHPFGQRPLPMRTAVLGGEQPAVALAEDGDLLLADDIAAALSRRDSADGCPD